jgi:uncharacterized membrane protein
MDPSTVLPGQAMNATLVLAVAAIALWVVLLFTLPPSGWLHIPLALGVTLLVLWIATSDDVTSKP